MQAELQNLTLAVIGAIAAAVIGFLKWYPEHRKLKAQMEIKKEDAQLADKAAERKQDDDQWDLLKTSLQTGVQAAQNTLQLATQMAIMSQLMERKLELITGIKVTVEGANTTLTSLDTFTRENLAPISQIVRSIDTLHTIAAGNEERGKQIIDLLENLRVDIQRSIDKRKTHGDSEPLKPVVTSEVIVTPVELPKASGQ